MQEIEEEAKQKRVEKEKDRERRAKLAAEKEATDKFKSHLSSRSAFNSHLSSNREERTSRLEKQAQFKYVFNYQITIFR
jgi:N-acyl-D-aspartate/D-glutamate deacylase